MTVAQRRFLPALREALGLEQKSLTITGYGGTAGLSARTSTYGARDAAAGWDMNTVVADGFERVVWVYKAVEIISGNASRLPFRITAGQGDDMEEVTDHPLLRLMNKQANPMETGRAFRKRLSAQVLLSKKGAFVEVTKTRGGAMNRLDLLDPSRVRIVPDLIHGEYVDYFEFTQYDGTVRELRPEQVRWIREPHPLDPFSGTTPLEAAGMSIELDHLARAYNVSFINRDGRPGGILGVDADGLEDTELDRIQARLKPGPYFAGAITAIGTGPGGLNYVDTSSRPRDMAYETTSEKAKKEILAAFGVPESIAGNASERTFDNAEQEEYNFWHDPMLPHLELIAGAFDGDVDADLDCGYDTSGVEALELPARRRRQEQREEVDKGLRTIKEYRDGIDVDPIDNPQTRALWVSPAKSPIPSDTPGDAEALGMAQGGGQVGDMGPGGPPMGPDGAPLPPDAPVGQTAAEVVAEARAAGGDAPDAMVADAAAVPEGPAAAAVDQARAEHTVPEGGEAALAVDEARMEGKALPHDDEPAGAYEPGGEEERRVELAVTAALEAMFARQAGVVAARLESPKFRRGTSYWTAADENDTRTGQDPIEADRVVDVARWVGETQETLRPLVGPAAKDSAEGLLTQLAATGALVLAVGASAQVAGRTVEAPKATAEQITAYAARAGIAPAMLALTIAQDAMSTWLGERVVDLNGLMSSGDAPDVPSLVEAVKKMWEEKARTFSESLAVTVAQTVVSGGRDSAVEKLVPQVAAPPAGEGYDMVETIPVIDRHWRTRHDERVRASHEAADGQIRSVGELFDVGGYDMRYPSDPLAPPQVSRWCRCHLDYTWPAGSKFRLPVDGE